MWSTIFINRHHFPLPGTEILQQNGTAVDAAVAASFCLGLFSMHSTGIGGGGLMVVYKRDTKTVESYDYREVAPGKSREDMYVDNPDKSKIGKCVEF